MTDVIINNLGACIATAAFSILTVAVKHLFSKMKKYKQDQETVRKGVVVMLHFQLYQTCQVYIRQGYITIEDLKSIEYLYREYTKLGGNGTGTELFKRCQSLPIRKGEK